MQSGWLGLLQCDRLHRDISIGNLLLLTEPVERPKFRSELPGRLKSLDGFVKSVQFHGAASGRLLTILESLGVNTSCTAIVMDFDLVAELENNTDRGRGHLVRTLVIRRGRMLTNTF